MDPRAKRFFILLHAGILAAILLFPVYLFLTDLLPDRIPECFLHDFLFLYCPFCGGTRALGALLKLQVVDAFLYNPLVVLMAVFAIAVDLRAFVRLRRGEREIYPIPNWAWILSLVILIFYGVLRNFLMIRYGYDPLGDLARFWGH